MKANLLFISIVCAVVICLITAGQIGKKQDNEFNAEYRQYKEALKFIEASKGASAIPTLEKLIKENPGRYNLHKNIGLAYIQAGDNKKAVIEFQKAVELRPFLVKSGNFTAQYGEILFRNMEYSKARVYFEQAILNGLTPEIEQYSKEMIIKIDKLENNGG